MIWHPTEVQFALIRNRIWPAAQWLPAAVEERRKTQRTMAAAHNHRSKNPPSNAAQAACHPSPPWTAHQTLSLIIAPTPPPTQYTVVGSHSREGSWQTDDGWAASKEVPATSWGWQQHHSPPYGSKIDGFSRSHWHVTLCVLVTTSPPAPSWGWQGEEPLLGLTPLSSVIQDSSRTSQPPDWHMVVGCKQACAVAFWCTQSREHGNEAKTVGMWSGDIQVPDEGKLSELERCIH